MSDATTTDSDWFRESSDRMLEELGIDRDAPHVRPQAGPQTDALKNPADIVVMGGANGGGKSFWMLLEAARHATVPNWRAVIFRRESTDITDAGGIWDGSMQVYPQIGGWPRSGAHDWIFDPDGRISFRHLQYYKDATSWDGKELAFIGFDEGQTFLDTQFWYLVSRMRTTCGKRPVVRMTCNPVHEDDPTGGWLKRLIGWWLDWDTGFPIQERSGVIRWFARLNNELVWADSAEELIWQYGNPDLPKDHEDQTVQPMSLTFIPSKLKDNPILMRGSPQYRASLMALPDYLRKQKLEGNWNAKLQAGTFFKIGVMSQPGMIISREELPKGLRYVRCWDLAHTEGAGDWTAGVLMATDGNGYFWIVDIVRVQLETFGRDDRIAITAEMDDSDKMVMIRLPEDPAAGKSEAARMVKTLRERGHLVKAVRVGSRSKDERQSVFAREFNGGKVRLVKAPWNSGFLQRLDAFPTKGIPDDEGDACADSIEELSVRKKLMVGTGPEQPVDQPPKTAFDSMADNYVRDLWEKLKANEPMCPQWKGSFVAFRDAVGPRPTPEHELRQRSEHEKWQPDNVFWGLPGEESPKVVKRKAFIVG